MLRRFSTNFKKSKGDKEERREAKENGQVNGKRHSLVAPIRKSTSSPSTTEEEETPQGATRNAVQSTFEKYSQVIHASTTPLPRQTGDSTFLEQDTTQGIFGDIKALGFRDVNTLKDLIKSKASGELVDDKTMLMERIIQLVSGLPAGSKNRVELTNIFLDELWNSLPHPPLSYMGDDYQYRSADGSNNNPTLPWLGAANTAYSRSISPLTIQPSGLPDAGLVFDSLMAREKFNPHPNKVSSLFFDWASLVIHDIFQTDYRNPSINKTSAYLDLSILYGDVQEEQDLVRTHKDGKLKPDAFSEPRLQAFPAACCVLLVMLNRFHNHVVEQLALINENGRFTKPSPKLPEEQAKQAWAKYDNDLFQTGRLVTCGLFINITLYDYLRTIVNLNRSNTTWCLDPRAHMEKAGATPQGMGNQCSVEFNLAYRWHSAISANDEKYTEKIYEELMGKPAEEVTIPELLIGLGKYEANLDRDPAKRTFAHLERQEDGTFRDDDLVNILSNAVEDVASSFGARNVPKALRSIEILGINQARRWNVGSLNEFRKFFGLKAYDSFEEINSDPDVADSLRHLYEHPDFVELYPGIVSEEAKEPMIPGVGIAPTYTVSRAVLSDAVALVRGDRFYTVDQNPRNLTNWGYSESRYDLSVNQGCVFYKLCLRAFPNHFKPDSIYAHYPMTIPGENRNIMKDLGRESHYSYDRPSYTPPKVNLSSYSNVKRVVEQPTDFRALWGEVPAFVFGKTGYEQLLAGDSSFGTQQKETITQALSSEEWNKQVKTFYEDITLKLLREKTGRLAGRNQIDITRDIGNLAHTHFAANVFSLPLKTADNPKGIFTEQELYMALAAVFTSIYFDVDPAKSFSLRHASHAVVQQLGQAVEASLKGTSGFLSGILGGSRKTPNALAEYGAKLIKQLLDSGLNASEVTWAQIIPAAIGMVPNQGQAFTRIIDYFLSADGAQHLPEINRLAQEDTPESEEKLRRYVLEAIRINGASAAYREAQTSAILNDNGREISVNPGDKVFVGFAGANHDAEVFPEPNQVRLDRPLEAYIPFGVGPHASLGKDTSLVALTTMLRVVGGLPNLRRAPGPQGQLKKVQAEEGYTAYMREDNSGHFPFPMTFKVHFDGEIPGPKRG
ncbi:peroxidase/cytochrome P450 family protein [Aspergillus glaucus CBS 516.65]|uniref:Linoleate 8R-lipoxygenase n=1 Tax=Aspergillus glaucus CBS 516.65 TaxID=1160497 RepID=A0A1L9VU11_ASPGL|nr:hypothetical protein ASPGLDRAFT_120623 [Aspergillus glaucus CBS 516.65]OJJ87377.1 hypothetical protein ASPGLDRAFT_120623 [Aspergillus glaucus CBS 516.65]